MFFALGGRWGPPRSHFSSCIFLFSSETPLGHFSKLPQWCLTEKIHFRSCICVFRAETPLGHFPKLPQWCLRPKSHFWSCIFKTTKKETLTLKQTQRDIQPPRKQKDDDMTIIQMNPRKDTYILTLTPKKPKTLNLETCDTNQIWKSHLCIYITQRYLIFVFSSETRVGQFYYAIATLVSR